MMTGIGYNPASRETVETGQEWPLEQAMFDKSGTSKLLRPVCAANVLPQP